MDDLAETVGTYDDVADEYESRHRDRSAVADLVERFRGALKDRVEGGPSAARVLDAGCGPGWETETFADWGADVVAIDLTSAFARRTADRVPDASVARMDMRHLGLPSESLDGVWACASFLHVPRDDAQATLASFATVLRPGGALLLAVKQGDGTRQGDSYDGDERRFTLYRPAELREMLVEAGLTPEWVEADGDWVTVLARR